MDTLIRPAVPGDAPALAHVLTTSMRDAFQGIAPEHCLQWPDSEANWRKTLTEDLGNGLFLDVAQAADGLVVGYLMTTTTSDNPMYRGELISLGVLPAYQRRGIGALLVCHAARKLAEHGVNSLLVRVLRDNPNRIFYERLGAQYISEHPYDWDGVLFSECIYGWGDTQPLIAT